MKKVYLSIITFLVTLLIAPFALASTNISSDHWYSANVSAASATVGTPITLQITFSPDGRGCGGSLAHEEMDLSISGAATLSRATLTVTPTNMGVTNYPAVTINSTSAGAKTISATAYCTAGDHSASSFPYSFSLGTVTFNAAPATTPTNNNTSNSSRSTSNTSSQDTSQTTNNTATTNTPPAVPILESLKVGETRFAADKIIEQSFKENDTKLFSGKTIPNGVVHLYFHSEPFEDAATADANGVWSYELKRDLGAGEHTLQIAVTDPKTNLTSEKSPEQKFTLVASEQAIKTNEVDKTRTSNQIWYILTGIIALLAVSGTIVFVLWKKRRIKAVVN